MGIKPAVRRRIKRLLIYLLTPFVLIGLTELLLRYAGYGQSSELFFPAARTDSNLVQNSGFAKTLLSSCLKPIQRIVLTWKQSII